MKFLGKLHPGWGLGLLVLGFGMSAFLGFRNLRSHGRYLQDLAKVERDMRDVLSVRSRQEQRIAQQFLEPFRPLPGIVGEPLLDQVQIEQLLSEPLPDGRRVEASRLDFSGLSWMELRDLISRLENGLPPWRLDGIRLEVKDVSDLSGSLEVRTLKASAPPQ
jgi:hypothetical protein